MSDRIFFPLALLLLIGMTWLALTPGIGKLPTGAVTGDGVNYDVIRIDDTYLNKLEAGGEGSIQLLDSNAGKAIQIRLSAEDVREDPLLNPHFRLAADIETQFSGMIVRVTVRVKPTETGGAERVALNYSAGRAGESGWQILDLKADYSDVSFEYRVPVVEGDQGIDYLAIRPVAPDKMRGIVLQSITFERLGRWSDPGGPAEP